jgi:hypothetical protein
VCAQAPCEECVVLTATIKDDKATIKKNKITIKEMGARMEVCVRARAGIRAFVFTCAIDSL